MLDKDEFSDSSFQQRSLLNPEGLIGQVVAATPTNGLSVLTMIPLVDLGWHPYEMPKVERKLRPIEHKGVSNWETSIWDGKQIFRGVVKVNHEGVPCERFVFFVPSGFPMQVASIEEQIKFRKKESLPKSA